MTDCAPRSVSITQNDLDLLKMANLSRIAFETPIVKAISSVDWAANSMNLRAKIQICCT